MLFEAVGDDASEDFVVYIQEGDGSVVLFSGVVLAWFGQRLDVCVSPGGGVGGCGPDLCVESVEKLAEGRDGGIEGIAKSIWSWGGEGRRSFDMVDDLFQGGRVCDG